MLNYLGDWSVNVCRVSYSRAEKVFKYKIRQQLFLFGMSYFVSLRLLVVVRFGYTAKLARFSEPFKQNALTINFFIDLLLWNHMLPKH